MHNQRSRWLRRLILPTVRRGERFRRDDNGVTDVEFAILALPFFTIISAILETAMIFLGGQFLDSAVQDASRLVRTGSAQAFNTVQFREQLCNGLYGLFDCEAGPGERLRIRVEVINSFSAAQIGYPLSSGEDCTEDGCDWVLSEGFTPGLGGDVVLVQAYYKWPTLINLPGFNFGNLPDGSRLMGASRVFKNEPF